MFLVGGWLIDGCCYCSLVCVYVYLVVVEVEWVFDVKVW